MRLLLPISLLFFLILFLFPLQSCLKDNAGGNPCGPLRVGDNIGDFTLYDQNANTVSLSDFRGKRVLLEFWASWCGYCLRETPELNQLYQDFKGPSFEIIAVSIDNDQQAWMDQVALNGSQFIHLNDPGGFDAQLIQCYGISSIPKFILLDTEGKVVLICQTVEKVRGFLENSGK